MFDSEEDVMLIGLYVISNKKKNQCTSKKNWQAYLKQKIECMDP